MSDYKISLINSKRSSEERRHREDNLHPRRWKAGWSGGGIFNNPLGNKHYSIKIRKDIVDVETLNSTAEKMSLLGLKTWRRFLNSQLNNKAPPRLQAHSWPGLYPGARRGIYFKRLAFRTHLSSPSTTPKPACSTRVTLGSYHPNICAAANTTWKCEP